MLKKRFQFFHFWVSLEIIYEGIILIMCITVGGSKTSKKDIQNEGKAINHVSLQ